MNKYNRKSYEEKLSTLETYKILQEKLSPLKHVEVYIFILLEIIPRKTYRRNIPSNHNRSNTYENCSFLKKKENNKKHHYCRESNDNLCKKLKENATSNEQELSELIRQENNKKERSIKFSNNKTLHFNFNKNNNNDKSINKSKHNNINDKENSYNYNNYDNYNNYHHQPQRSNLKSRKKHFNSLHDKNVNVSIERSQNKIKEEFRNTYCYQKLPSIKLEIKKQKKKFIKEFGEKVTPELEKSYVNITNYHQDNYGGGENIYEEKEQSFEFILNLMEHRLTESKEMSLNGSMAHSCHSSPLKGFENVSPNKLKFYIEKFSPKKAKNDLQSTQSIYISKKRIPPPKTSSQKETELPSIKLITKKSIKNKESPNQQHTDLNEEEIAREMNAKLRMKQNHTKIIEIQKIKLGSTCNGILIEEKPQ